MNKKIFGIFAVALFAIMAMAPMCVAEDINRKPDKPADCEDGTWVKVVDVWEDHYHRIRIEIEYWNEYLEEWMTGYKYEYAWVRVPVQWHWILVDEKNEMCLDPKQCNCR